MGTSIQDFLANFKGGARPNQFRVLIYYPAVADAGAAAQNSEFLCHGASLPNFVLGTVPVIYLGRTITFAGDRTFQPWTVTIYNEENFAHRDAFERWSEAIQGVGTNRASVDFEDYVATADVYQLNRKHETIKSYRLFNIWPSDVSDISLDWQQNDTVEEFTVTFELSHFETNTTVNE